MYKSKKEDDNEKSKEAKTTFQKSKKHGNTQEDQRNSKRRKYDLPRDNWGVEKEQEQDVKEEHTVLHSAPEILPCSPGPLPDNLKIQ